LTTKIHTLTDAEGRPLRFILTGGETHDVTTAADLLDGQNAAGIIADKAYDTNALREVIEEAKMEAVIPSKRNRKIQIPHDAQAYKLRNRIERFFNKLKHFRRIATRYDRRSDYFLAAVQLASSMIWMR
jgi:transposase